MWLVVLVSIIVVLQRLSELLLSHRNAQKAFKRGGVEYGAGHYWMFVVLHSGWLIGMNVEWFLGDRILPAWWPWMLALYALLQGLRYWVIGTLGDSWNARIITWPGMPRIRSGPYRWFRHPNYIVVAIELAAVPLMWNARVTAIIATICNACILLAVRIPAEERALSREETTRQ